MSGVNECFVTLVLRPGWSLSALETAKMAAKLEPFSSVDRDFTLTGPPVQGRSALRRHVLLG